MPHALHGATIFGAPLSSADLAADETWSEEHFGCGQVLDPITAWSEVSVAGVLRVIGGDKLGASRRLLPCGVGSGAHQCAHPGLGGRPLRHGAVVELLMYDGSPVMEAAVMCNLAFVGLCHAGAATPLNAVDPLFGPALSFKRRLERVDRRASVGRATSHTVCGIPRSPQLPDPSPHGSLDLQESLNGPLIRDSHVGAIAASPAVVAAIARLPANGNSGKGGADPSRPRIITDLVTLAEWVPDCSSFWWASALVQSQKDRLLAALKSAGPGRDTPFINFTRVEATVRPVKEAQKLRQLLGRRPGVELDAGQESLLTARRLFGLTAEDMPDNVASLAFDKKLAAARRPSAAQVTCATTIVCRCCL